MVSSLPDPTKYVAVEAGRAMDRGLLAKIKPQVCRKLDLLVTEEGDHS